MANEIQDYEPGLGDAASRRLETFSYLPQMDAARIRQQVAYIVNKGWTPAIEHSEPENAGAHYWHMWKLPMFGETDVGAILAEAEACRGAHPTHHVRLIGYDRGAQSQGAAMVIHRAAAERC